MNGDNKIEIFVRYIKYIRLRIRGQYLFPQFFFYLFFICNVKNENILIFVFSISFVRFSFRYREKNNTISNLFCYNSKYFSIETFRRYF